MTPQQHDEYVRYLKRQIAEGKKAEAKLKRLMEREERLLDRICALASECQYNRD